MVAGLVPDRCGLALGVAGLGSLGIGFWYILAHRAGMCWELVFGDPGFVPYCVGLGRLGAGLAAVPRAAYGYSNCDGCNKARGGRIPVYEENIEPI